jgi:ketosteroid isomerase-like protein
VRETAGTTLSYLQYLPMSNPWREFLGCGKASHRRSRLLAIRFSATVQNTQMQTRRELLTNIYAAFNRRDIDGVLASMRPDVDWPNGMEGGRVHGHEGVRAYWQRQWAKIDPHVEPINIEDDPAGNTVVNVHQVIRDLSGKVLKDQMVRHVYSFRDGLIERMDISSKAA